MKKQLFADSTMTQVVVWGSKPLVPEDVMEDDVLTAEDYREIALEHIERTSKVVFQLQIVKRA